MKTLKQPVEFIWNKGNRDKNWIKHRVSYKECEEVFFDPDKQEYPDPIHSENETRKIVIGKTKKERLLFIVYTLRRNKIRIISARDLNKKEEILYEKATQATKVQK